MKGKPGLAAFGLGLSIWVMGVAVSCTPKASVLEPGTAEPLITYGKPEVHYLGDITCVTYRDNLWCKP